MPEVLDMRCVVELASVAGRVANATYAEEGLHAVVQAAQDIFKAQTVAVLLLDKTGEGLSIKLARGLSARYVTQFSRELGTGLVAEVVMGGMLVRLPDQQFDEGAHAELKLENDFSSAIAIGLTINRRPAGYLYCDHMEADHFGAAALQITRCLGHLAALAVEKARLQEKVSRLTVTEALTGLSTYRHFHERLVMELGRAKRYGEGLALVLMEMTNLSYLEEVYGRPAGWEILKYVARTIREGTRGVDFAARFRHNQVMVCLVHRGEEGLHTVAGRICSKASKAPTVCRTGEVGEAPGEGAVELSISAGGVVVRAAGEEAVELVSRVQGALLAAKRMGSGGLSIAES